MPQQATDKLDFKKAYPELYAPKAKPTLIDVPEIPFIMVDGEGDPNSEAFQNAVPVLYGLTFTIKMSKMGGQQPDGYFEYTVPPLEGLWWREGGALDFHHRDAWR